MSSSVKVMRARRGTAAAMWPMSKLRIGGMETVDIGGTSRGGRVHRAQMSVQLLKPSDTLAGPGDPAMPTGPSSSKSVRRCPFARRCRNAIPRRG
jgi:hypothetical protein